MPADTRDEDDIGAPHRSEPTRLTQRDVTPFSDTGGIRFGNGRAGDSVLAMAKRSATKARDESTQDGPNPRQPCPCGSGKRYKACHGSAGGTSDVIVTRPFEGLAGECELVALREFVPSATAPLPLAGDPDRDVTLATVLPMAAAAIVREDGSALVGLQVQTR